MDGGISFDLGEGSGGSSEWEKSECRIEIGGGKSKGISDLIKTESDQGTSNVPGLLNSDHKTASWNEQAWQLFRTVRALYTG